MNYLKDMVVGFADNLKKLMKLRKLTAKDIAEKMNITRGTVTNWSNGERFPQKAEYIEDLADTLDVPEQMLFNDSEKTLEKITKQEMQTHPDKYANLLPTADIKDGFCTIPILHDINVAAGIDGSNFHDISPEHTTFQTSFLQKFYKVQNVKNVAYIRVTGNSMEPFIKDGEYIIVEHGVDVRDGNIVIVRLRDELFCKKIFKDPMGNWARLESENSDYRPIELNTKEEVNELEVLAVVRCRTRIF